MRYKVILSPEYQIPIALSSHPFVVKMCLTPYILPAINDIADGSDIHVSG